MKTKSPIRSLVILAISSIALISCSKESSSLNPVTGTPVNPPPVPIVGSIVDLGPTASNTRVMQLALNQQNFILYFPDESVSNAPAQFQVTLYANSDGLIPTGEYTFTNSGTKTPFTFDSGNLKFAVGSDSYSNQTDPVVDGSIIVTQDGDKYVFALQVNLASGLTTSDIYSGSITYSDFSSK